MYTDLHARIDDRLTQKQMIHCCNLLLSNDDEYMSTKMTPLSRLSLLVDLRGTHTMMGRSEDGRIEIIVFNFLKKVSRIGPSVEGHEVLHTMLN